MTRDLTARLHPSGGDLAAQLLSLEQELLSPAVRRDPARLAALLTPGFIEFGASGRVYTRDQIIAALANEPASEFSLSDFQCHQLAPAVALTTWRSTRTNASAGERTSALRSSIWILENDSWRLRFHQGTRV